jgi:hypothetical protein
MERNRLCCSAAICCFGIWFCDAGEYAALFMNITAGAPETTISAKEQTMTLRQRIQAAPAKANELFGKLATTSNQAIKTRECFFADLMSELTLYADVEEQHLLPLLRKNPDTKVLATVALKSRKELRRQLTDIAAAPKGTDEFQASISELSKSFQQHLRDERQDRLPALLRLLSDEESRDLADRLEGAVVEAWTVKLEAKREAARQVKAEAEEADRLEAEAENAKREARRDAARKAKAEADEAERLEAEAEKAEREAKREAARRAKAEADEAERIEAEGRAAVEAEQAAEREALVAAKQLSEIVEHEAASVSEAVCKVTAEVLEQTEQAISAIVPAMAVDQGAMQKTAGNLRAGTVSSDITSKAATVGSAWMNWVGRLARINLDTTQKLMRCRTLVDVAETQREFLTNSMSSWVERNAQVLKASNRTSQQIIVTRATRRG